ncbi:MAG: sulfatase [Luteolibacter sp.]
MTRSLIAALALLAPAIATARPALEKPNVIVVLLDDAGYGDFSHTGNPTINTPNLSRMVSEGLNFPQFYCGSSACTASRYSILTGRNPIRSGLGSWVLGPESPRYMHPSEVTLAEGLKHQGYATGMFGKWHLGTPNAANQMSADALPLAHGFDQWIGTNVSHDYDHGTNLIRSNPQGTSPVQGYETLEKDILGNVPVLESLTKRYTDEAIEFIKAKKDAPFFIYFTPNYPHLPVHASKDFQGTSLRGLYGDCIEEIDSNLGRLRTALEQAGIAQNTLVIFASDNGPWIKYQDTAKDAKYGEARMLIGSALPFRDGKGSTWEGGQRVPGVFWWPGTIRPGTVVQAPASTMDVLPTAFALAGEPLPTGRTLDGRDLRPYFNADKFPGTVPGFTLAFSGFGDNSIGAIRKGPWKLHIKISSQTNNNYGFKPTPEKPLLFNVEQDPGERVDRAAEQPQVVAEMKKLLSDYVAAADKEGSFWGPLPKPDPKAKGKAGAKPADEDE